jgi:hypothetical protein
MSQVTAPNFIVCAARKAGAPDVVDEIQAEEAALVIKMASAGDFFYSAPGFQAVADMLLARGTWRTSHVAGSTGVSAVSVYNTHLIISRFPLEFRLFS